jgi:hypothetical protein
VIAAVAAGKHAALMIDRFLNGRQMKLIPRVKLPTTYIPPVGTDEEDEGAAGRVAVDHLPVAARSGNFLEVDLCITEDRALCEARRCLRCDIEFTLPAGH